MKNALKKEHIRYYLAALLIAGLSNRAIFFFGHLLSQGARHWDLSLRGEPLLPFVPWTIWIYFAIIPWCMFVYFLVVRRERAEADRFFCALLLTKLICLLFFVFLPASIERSEPSGSSLSVQMLRLLYVFDTPDNLFPSVHCLLAWLCWIGVRGRREHPFPLRAAAFLMAAAVCVSTLTVRQHVLCDVFAGILLAELGWQLAKIPALRGLYAALSDALVRLLFRGRTVSR